ncbi:GGDEF domain-containing protein [Domibacillus indicus]|uniref:GGDEF domain-containing protein n=1 Tax=Domibacillus indicus TaxID=1437523 RepID=UPI0006983591|nr:GGDEF domain-containing protein [Domibacillus indicus]
MKNKQSSENYTKKYQEFLDVNNAVIFQLDLEREFISLNSEWTKLTGYTVTESLGKSFFDIVSADDRAAVQQQFAILISGQKDGIHKEIKVAAKQKKIEEAHLFLRADRDSEQKIVSFSGTITHLSPRKPGIDAYKKNERNYRLISEHMTDMVAVLAEDGLVLYASPSHAAVLGRNLDEYIGSYPIKHIHPEDWERVFHFFHEMVSNWSPAEIEYRCMHDNGEWIYLEMKCTPIKGPDEEVQIISVSRDITLRKRMEEELRQTTMKLKTLISSLPYGVMVEDEEGKRTLYNEAYENIFHGYSIEEKAGGPLKGESQNIMEYFPFYSCQNCSSIPRQSGELFLKDGRIVESDAVPLLEGGKFDGYLWIFRDVTEKKAAEKKLQEANQILKRLSMIDGLTKIANRRSFDEALEKEWNQSKNLQEPISLLMIDIDFFKAFNDLYGHQAGDACLQKVGEILKNISGGPQELAARYGGEEFAVLLPGRKKEKAIETAYLIQEAIQKARIRHRGSPIKEYLTLSIGVATVTAAPADQSEGLLSKADKALYEAKRKGRNQIEVYKPQIAERE